MSDDRFPAVQSPYEVLAVHRERLKSLRADVDEHDSQIGSMTAAVARVESGINELKGKVDDIAEHVDTLLQNYWQEHPSKVQSPPIGPQQSPLSQRDAYKVDAKKLGLTIGGFFGAIEIWMQLHDAFAKWIGHH